MQWRGHEAKRKRLERLDFSSVMECLTYMKHNERARVPHYIFLLNFPFVHRQKRNVYNTHTPPGLVLGLLARCVGLFWARSLRSS